MIDSKGKRRWSLPSDISSIIYRQASIILMVRYPKVLLQPIRLRVADIRAIEKRAQKEQRQDRQNSGESINTVRSRDIRGGHLRSSFSIMRRVRAERSRAFMLSLTMATSSHFSWREMEPFSGDAAWLPMCSCGGVLRMKGDQTKER